MSEDKQRSSKGANWRSIGVKRERAHEPITKTLVSGQKPVFRFLKDLMVFAALVGHSMGERKPLSGETIEIILDTYATDEQDGFIYLLGLLELRDANFLRDEKLAELIPVFEEYCNAGLYQIENWLDDNAGDPDGIETLINKTIEALAIEEVEKGEEIAIQIV